MKYKGYLLTTIPKIPNDCKTLINLIEEHTKLDITTKTRKIEYIYARKIYYKILSVTSDMTSSAMAKTLMQTHATVLHAIKNFDWDYDNNNDFKETFNFIYNIYKGDEPIITVDELRHENITQRKKIQELENTILKLKAEIKQVRSNNITPRNQQTKIYASTDNISDYTY